MVNQHYKLKQSLPPNWECKIDPQSGQPYYVNHQTKETSWEPPHWECKIDSQSGQPYYVNHQTKETRWESPQEDSQTTSVTYLDVDDYHDLSPEWELKLDTRTGKEYFVNHKTKTTTWDDPRRRHKDEAVCARSSKVSYSYTDLLMKNCRYVKSTFPKAEETVILEILSNNDCNIKKTSEILQDMGFQRKDTVKPAQQKLDAKIEAEKVKEADNIVSPAPPPKVKSLAEKAALKQQFKERYKHVPDQVIIIALESVDFNEDRAIQILEIMMRESGEKEKNATVSSDITDHPETEVTETDSKVSSAQSRQSIKSLLQSDKIVMDNISNREDYVEWKRSNKTIWKGPQGLAKGPNRSLLGPRSYQPCGPNPELQKGPQYGLAKGSIFSHSKSNIADESPGN